MKSIILDEKSLAHALWPGLNHLIHKRVEEHIRGDLMKVVADAMHEWLKEITITECREENGKYIFTLQDWRK